MKRRKFIYGSAMLGVSFALPKFLNATSGMFESVKGRNVFKILNTDKTKVGTLPILRAFAGDHLDHVSPYVLFDEFGPVELTPKSQPLRVDAHPHAGIIPTTYFLSGTGHHKDSLNYDFQIGKGDFMMFSSGKGAIHMEETGKSLYDNGGIYHGFQIWLNMPAKYKLTAPATFVHKEDKIGKIETKTYSAKVILGELFDAKFKIELLSSAFYFHLNMKANCRLDIPTNSTHNAFIYVIKGSIEVEGRRQVNAGQVVLYERGDSLINLFSEKGTDLLVLGGKPLNEPVFSYGSFVMNTEAEIQQCIRD